MLHLTAKLENKPMLDLIKQKLAVNDLIFKDGYFESKDSSNHKGFKILNGEKPGLFQEDNLYIFDDNCSASQGPTQRNKNF